MSHALAEVMPEWCSDNNSRKSNLSFGEVQPSAAGIGAPYMLSSGARSALPLGDVQPSDAGIGAPYMLSGGAQSALPLGDVQPSDAGIGAPYMLSDGAIDYAASLFSGIF